MNTNCAAHGCPLPGAFTDSTMGSNDWVCWIHERVAPAYWPRATATINRNAWLVETLQVVASWAPHNHGWAIGAALATKKMGRPDLEPEVGESSVAYCKRMRMAITALVKEFVTAESAERAREPRDPWQRVRSLVNDAPAA